MASASRTAATWRLLLTGTCWTGEAESTDCGGDSKQLQEAGERGWGSVLTGKAETQGAQVCRGTAQTLQRPFAENGGGSCSSSPGAAGAAGSPVHRPGRWGGSGAGVGLSLLP